MADDECNINYETSNVVGAVECEDSGLLSGDELVTGRLITVSDDYSSRIKRLSSLILL